MQIWTAARDFFAQHTLLAIALVLFVEELGVPLLLPGDLLMVLAGIEIARGRASLTEVLAIEFAATTPPPMPAAPNTPVAYRRGPVPGSNTASAATRPRTPPAGALHAPPLRRASPLSVGTIPSPPAYSELP